MISYYSKIAVVGDIKLGDDSCNDRSGYDSSWGEFLKRVREMSYLLFVYSVYSVTDSWDDIFPTLFVNSPV